jgi:hypothetical protein
MTKITEQTFLEMEDRERDAKVCTSCGEKKPLSVFETDARKKNGRGSRCNECCAARKRRYRRTEKGKEASRIAKRKYTHSEKGRATIKNYFRSKNGNAAIRRKYSSYFSKHPERVAVYAAVTAAKKNGDLVPQPCEVCGSERVDAHHDDYSKPLEVRWLCKKHHGELHAEQSLVAGLALGRIE